MTRRSRYDLPVAALLVVALLVVMFGFTSERGANAAWSDEELATLHSLSLASLEPLAADPSNRYGDDPRAAALGEKLFFDERLSSNGKVSCGSCHLPGRHFQDGVALAQGVGTTTRRTMPIAGTAH